MLSFQHSGPTHYGPFSTKRPPEMTMGFIIKSVIHHLVSNFYMFHKSLLFYVEYGLAHSESISPSLITMVIRLASGILRRFFADISDPAQTHLLLKIKGGPYNLVLITACEVINV